MIRIFTLLVVVIGLSATAAQAQCTPDPLYADSTFGIWPDTTENLPGATLNQPYSTTLNVKVPSDGGDIDPQYQFITVDRIEMTNVSNVPPGLSYQCNNDSCTWPGGGAGCIQLSGTPTQLGTFTMTVTLVGYSTLLPNTPAATLDFDGYVVTVSDPSAVVERPRANLALTRISGTAAQQRISYKTQFGGAAQLQVFDMLGKQVHNERLSAIPGQNSIVLQTSSYEPGVYFVSLQQQGERVTQRMVIANR